jgi:hypothetical protein
MFYKCTSLKSIEVDFTEWDYSNTLEWVFWVHSEDGIFICPQKLPDERGETYIPEEWTIVRK